MNEHAPKTGCHNNAKYRIYFHKLSGTFFQWQKVKDKLPDGFTVATNKYWSLELLDFQSWNYFTVRIRRNWKISLFDFGWFDLLIAKERWFVVFIPHSPRNPTRGQLARGENTRAKHAGAMKTIYYRRK